MALDKTSTKSMIDLENHCSFLRFPINTTITYELKGETCPWLFELLASIESDAEIKEGENTDKRSIEFYGDITHVNTHKYGDILLINGDLKVSYLTNCVNTWAPMVDSVDIEIQAMAIDQRFEDDEYFKENTDTEYKGEIYEVFFMKNIKLDFASILSEFFYLNKNPYPKLESYSPTVSS